MELAYVNSASTKRNCAYLSESLINTIAPDISISPAWTFYKWAAAIAGKSTPLFRFYLIQAKL